MGDVQFLEFPAGTSQRRFQLPLIRDSVLDAGKGARPRRAILRNDEQLYAVRVLVTAHDDAFRGPLEDPCFGEHPRTLSADELGGSSVRRLKRVGIAALHAWRDCGSAVRSPQLRAPGPQVSQYKMLSIANSTARIVATDAIRNSTANSRLTPVGVRGAILLRAVPRRRRRRTHRQIRCRVGDAGVNVECLAVVVCGLAHLRLRAARNYAACREGAPVSIVAGVRVQRLPGQPARSAPQSCRSAHDSGGACGRRTTITVPREACALLPRTPQGL